MRYTCGLAQTQSSICRSVPVYVPTALTIVEPRSHWREISSAISCPLVVMIVSILPALLPYIILSITSDVTAVVTRPYKTASTEPNTGQPQQDDHKVYRTGHNTDRQMRAQHFDRHRQEIGAAAGRSPHIQKRQCAAPCDTRKQGRQQRIAAVAGLVCKDNILKKGTPQHTDDGFSPERRVPQSGNQAEPGAHSAPAL